MSCGVTTYADSATGSLSEMNCIVLQNPLCVHTFISSSCRHSFIALQSLKYGLNRKDWSCNTRCCSVGGDGVWGEDLFDGDSLKGRNNEFTSNDLDESAIASFRTVNAEITQETADFFVSDAEGDPDCPSEGFSSIDQAINALHQGKFVIAVDDENGEGEGDLVMAASLVNPKSIAFMIRHGSGIISVGMMKEDLERLRLPMMSPITEIEDLSAAASTVTVDARVGTSSGVSAADRARTILALSSLDSRPGTATPELRLLALVCEKCSDGCAVFVIGLKEVGETLPMKVGRAGHTEASVDLVSLAGLRPVSVLSTIVDPEDGSMPHLRILKKLAAEYGLPVISISDLIRYRRKREKLVERIAVSRLPTRWGLFKAYCYHSKLDGTEHVAVVKGDIGDGQDVLVRVHSECLTGDVFESSRCDCGNQLALAMQLIEQAGRGVLVYLRGHEGRGIGLGHKLRAYNLQDLGHDTVEANLELGLAIDSRDYGIGAQILRDIGVCTMRLMTNNPAKFIGLRGYGLAMIGRVPVLSPITEENKRYLETKRTKMGHVYGSDLPDTPTDFSNSVETPDQEKEM